MKHASNKPAPVDAADPARNGGEHADAVRRIWQGSLGRTVRCVPARRTLMACSRGVVLYGKLHLGSAAAAAAAAEWRWLHSLPLLAIAVPRPIAWIGDRRRSLIVTGRLPGRSLDAWACDAAREGWLAGLFGYALRELAPFVRRLHGAGLIHRDLNLPHLFVDDARAARAPAVLDVERMFRPRWRRRRWVVKDLASLLASVPIELPARIALRFLRVYGVDLDRAARRALAADVGRKVARIRRHRPRFG